MPTSVIIPMDHRYGAYTTHYLHFQTCGCYRIYTKKYNEETNVYSNICEYHEQLKTQDRISDNLSSLRHIINSDVDCLFSPYIDIKNIEASLPEDTFKYYKPFFGKNVTKAELLSMIRNDIPSNIKLRYFSSNVLLHLENATDQTKLYDLLKSGMDDYTIHSVLYTVY